MWRTFLPNKLVFRAFRIQIIMTKISNTNNHNYETNLAIFFLHVPYFYNIRNLWLNM